MSNRNQALKAALECLKGGHFDRAADLCRPLVAADQNDADARFFLGVSQGARGQLPEATEHLLKVVKTQPNHIDARRELARLFQAQGKRAEAEAEYRAVLKLMPGDATAICTLGQFLMEDGRAAEAADQARAALAHQPHLAVGHNLLAIALVDQGQMEDGILSFGRAIAADPTNAGARANLGTALTAMGRFDEALCATNDALFLTPGDVTIHVNRAVTLLKAGRLLEGWSENEWRHRKPGREKLPAALRLPKLSYMGSLKGATVVVYHEEGFGDTLQFLRYVPMLIKAGAKVILWMPDELARLVRGQIGMAEVFTGNVTLPRFDFHSPIISLPHVFETTLETIPAAIPYIQPDPALMRNWAAKLPQTTDKKVGLVWAGEPRLYDPAAAAMDKARSLTLKALAPIIAVPNARFVSLQTGPAAQELTDTAIHNPMFEVRDFADTAAIIANLDIVISVDTAVAHLAGAMGKPVLLLDRADNCWRWLSGRNDSPWYPTLRIFRQPRAGKWEPAIENAAQVLRAFIPHG